MPLRTNSTLFFARFGLFAIILLGIAPLSDAYQQADQACDPDSPCSYHDPGIYLAKDTDGKTHTTVLDQAKPQYPDCVQGRIFNSVGVTFAGAQAVIRTNDARPVFYFSFENTGGTSQFADTSLTTPNQFTLVPLSNGKKGRQLRLAANCVAPTKISIRLKVERVRPGFYGYRPQFSR